MEKWVSMKEIINNFNIIQSNNMLFYSLVANRAEATFLRVQRLYLKYHHVLFFRLVAEALEYQRGCSDQTSMGDLMSHVFLGCQQSKAFTCTCIHVWIILRLTSTDVMRINKTLFVHYYLSIEMVRGSWDSSYIQNHFTSQKQQH